MSFLRNAYIILSGIVLVVLHFVGMFPIVLILTEFMYDKLTFPILIAHIVGQLIFYDVYYKILNKISNG